MRLQATKLRPRFDITCYGGGTPTPRIDRLAAEGIRFNNYTVEAQCTPTRSAILTGRQPVLYTGPYFWRTYVAGDAAFAGFPLWIANYTTKASPIVPA